MSEHPPPDAGRTRAATVGVTTANVISAGCVVIIVGVLLYLGANALSVIRGGAVSSNGLIPVGSGFTSASVGVALTVFTFTMPLLATSGLVGILARRWDRGILTPAFHVTLAVISYLPVLFLTSLLPLGFIAYFFPFPLIALGVLIVWWRTERAVREADVDDRAVAQLDAQRRIDRAITVAVGIQVLFPALLILLSLVGVGV